MSTHDTAFALVGGLLAGYRLAGGEGVLLDLQRFLYILWS